MSFFMSILCLAGCGKNNGGNAEPIVENVHATHDSMVTNPADDPVDPESKIIDIKGRGMVLSAQLDSFGKLKILNYPSKWRGNAKLIHYDGNDSSPFSKKHCKEIKGIAKMGGSDLVRNAHHSVVAFELPFFLTSELNSAALNAVTSSASSLTSFEITNPPRTIGAGVLDLRFKEDAISLITGQLENLYEQLNFRNRGYNDESGQRTMIVVSGDVLCDLAEGSLKMVMTYPIADEERAVEIIYDRLEISNNASIRKMKGKKDLYLRHLAGL
jgi:hypothetical protein